MRRALALFILLALGATGCGYQVVRVSDAFGTANRIAIHGFRNDTMEAGVDSVVTDALAREVMQRGALRMIDDPGSADWVLTGVVSRLDVYNRSFSSVSFSLEYEVRLVLDVVIERRDGTRLVLDPQTTQGRERYLASADAEVARTNREEAIRRIASQLAARIHDAFYERVAVGTGTGSPAP